MDGRFAAIFVELRAIALAAAPAMLVSDDSAASLILKTAWPEARTGQPAWFAALAIKKSYVSVHIMPLYTLAALDARVPAILSARRQGKTCFNFKQADAAQFAAIGTLVAAAAAMEPDWRAIIGG